MKWRIRHWYYWITSPDYRLGIGYLRRIYIAGLKRHLLLRYGDSGNKKAINFLSESDIKKLNEIGIRKNEDGIVTKVEHPFRANKIDTLHKEENFNEIID